MCNTKIENNTLIFKKPDLEINSIIYPNNLTEKDLVCVTCFNEMLENPASQNDFHGIVIHELPEIELDNQISLPLL